MFNQMLLAKFLESCYDTSISFGISPKFAYQAPGDTWTVESCRCQ
uniref:Uncharacterized protein n=1 Tax=Arundo donax TaxID=35708 RepID=A0A0A8YXZ1_ARUDO